MNPMKDNFEKMADMNKQGYDKLRELSVMQMDICNKLMEKQMNACNDIMDCVMSQSLLAANAKDYPSMMQNQVEMTRKLFTTMAEATRESVSLFQDSGEKCRAWAEGTAKEATDQMNEAVEKATAAA